MDNHLIMILTPQTIKIIC